MSHRDRTITMQLDGFELAGRPVEAVILEVDDPERRKLELDARRPAT